jgi:hypothetical protein
VVTDDELAAVDLDELRAMFARVRDVVCEAWERLCEAFRALRDVLQSIGEIREAKHPNPLGGRTPLSYHEPLFRVELARLNHPAWISHRRPPRHPPRRM